MEQEALTIRQRNADDQRFRESPHFHKSLKRNKNNTRKFQNKVATRQEVTQSRIPETTRKKNRRARVQVDHDIKKRSITGFVKHRTKTERQQRIKMR